MKQSNKRRHRLECATYGVLAILLVAIWARGISNRLNEREEILLRIDRRLDLMATMLVDVQKSGRELGGSSFETINKIQADVIERVLKIYPDHYLWLGNEQGIVVGRAPANDLGSYIVTTETRDIEGRRFVARAALSRADAFSDWRRRVMQSCIWLIFLSAMATASARFLVGAWRKRAIADRRKSAAMRRLQLRERALEAISQGVTILNEQAPGRPIMYANAAYSTLTRHPLAALKGRSPSAFFKSNDAAEIEQFLAHAANDKRPWRVEVEAQRKDSSSFIDQISTSLIFGKDGEITHSVMVHEDVTQQRHHERLALESERVESVVRLTGGIAHDFNNLLTAISTNAEDLQEDLKENPLQRRQAELILLAARKASDLVRQLLAFARKQELQPLNTDVNSIIPLVVEKLQSSLPPTITIDIKTEDPLPPVRVDPHRLTDALLGLASNARDAMPQGGAITIETKTRYLDDDYAGRHAEFRAGRYVLIAVTDAGTGMAREVMENAFAPFFTTKDVGQGTGLGLSAVYGFVKQSDGHAVIYSEPNRGTVVKIYLPTVEEFPEPGKSALRSKPQPAGEKIIFIEDDDLVRKSIANKLVNFGYVVHAVRTAHEAMAALEKMSDIDLVFSDVITPGSMNGADLIREVRRRWPDKKVLMTSGYTERTIGGKIELPMDVQLLSKPYSNAELAIAVSTALHP